MSEQVENEHRAVCSRNGGRVLIVDDDELIVNLFRAILASATVGMEIDVAADGAQAVERFRARRHGVLLMDLHMPVMDGFSAFRRIEELCGEGKWRMPAVVFCTGFAPSDTLKQVLEEDPRHGFLSKPVAADQLVEAVVSRLSA